MALDIYFTRSFYTNTETIDGENYRIKLQKIETFRGGVFEELVEFLSDIITDDSIVNCADYDFSPKLIPNIIEFCQQQVVESDSKNNTELWNEVIEYLKKEETWFDQNQDKYPVMTFSIWY